MAKVCRTKMSTTRSYIAVHCWFLYPVLSVSLCHSLVNQASTIGQSYGLGRKLCIATFVVWVTKVSRP